MSATAGPVLVVDDDAAVRDALKFALEVEGLSVRVYPGGKELLAEQDLPARGCLVVDYAMPALNGVELMGELRRRQVSLPAILIASHASEALRAWATEAGFRQVLEKPLEDEALLEGIRSALATAPEDQGTGRVSS